MSLEDVKNDILQEAEDKSNEIKEQAEQKEKEILQEAEEKAEKIKQRAEKEIEEEKEGIEKKELSNARMQARKKKLEAKQEKLNEVFEEFQEELESLNKSERKSFVENCINQAEFEVGKILGNEDFGKAVDKRKYEFEQADVNGFVLVSEDGERRKNYSIEKIVKTYEDKYRKDVAQKLFSEE